MPILHHRDQHRLQVKRSAWGHSLAIRIRRLRGRRCPTVRSEGVVSIWVSITLGREKGNEFRKPLIRGPFRSALKSLGPTRMWVRLPPPALQAAVPVISPRSGAPAPLGSLRPRGAGGSQNPAGSAGTEQSEMIRMASQATANRRGVKSRYHLEEIMPNTRSMSLACFFCSEVSRREKRGSPG